LGIEFELKINEALGLEIQLNLMEFDFNFQELKNFEQEAPICTWIIVQILKRNLEFQICEFSRFTPRI
jgi:hypothetical protein